PVAAWAAPVTKAAARAAAVRMVLAFMMVLLAVGWRSRCVWIARPVFAAFSGVFVFVFRCCYLLLGREQGLKKRPPPGTDKLLVLRGAELLAGGVLLFPGWCSAVHGSNIIYY
ncbi:hypothetical protein, partial [Cupriavidus sp. YR651]|uniref:hypothetical protein n=1 Tax=Cupriavidus sp. YR651 TaxID=1855315 RepID=UPI001C408E17